MSLEPGTSSQPEDDTRRAWRLLAVAAVAYLALGMAANPLAAGTLKPGPTLIALVLLAGVTYIVIALVMVSLISRLPLSWKRQLAMGLAFAAAFAAARLARLSLVGDLFLVLAAVFIGALASRIVRERNLLLPVVVVAAAVDTWGVYWGFVAEIGKKAPQVAEQFSATVPGAAAPGVPVPLLSGIGIGDFMFMSLFMAAIYRLHMNARATLWGLFAVFLGVPVAFVGISALTGSQVPLLPGLAFVGLAVLVANSRQFRFSRAEKYALLYAAVIVAAVIALAWGVKRALAG